MVFRTERNSSEDSTSSTEQQDPRLTVKKFTRRDILICASHGYIYAIHKADGSRLWKTSFKSGSGIISLFVRDNDRLIAGAFGRTTCLNLLNGGIVWETKLAGMGSEEVSVVSTPSRVLRPHPDHIMELPPHYNEQSVPPDYHDNVVPESAVIIACSRGKAMGLDADSGEILWTYNCPGGGFNIPVVIVEPPSKESDQVVYIGASKWVYCLNGRTGALIWSTKVATTLFGSDYMSLATAWSSRLAAESYSAFNQNPSLQCLELQRDRNRVNTSQSFKRIGKTAAR
ncbi:hypothetical protein INT47_011807 [Mucor saturninus]|uniref:Pyrrolo-quinoline quinone repeat domain-containing protein n=1 Tax=Mucor saturninus TaxID=64648 RepID=A0A8H7RCC4_9FUNG|nr:hypothetical protein INT47_011807 [Mucor saturninus]